MITQTWGQFHISSLYRELRSKLSVNNGAVIFYGIGPGLTPNVGPFYVEPHN